MAPSAATERNMLAAAEGHQTQHAGARLARSTEGNRAAFFRADAMDDARRARREHCQEPTDDNLTDIDYRRWRLAQQQSATCSRQPRDAKHNTLARGWRQAPRVIGRLFSARTRWTTRAELVVKNVRNPPTKTSRTSILVDGA